MSSGIVSSPRTLFDAVFGRQRSVLLDAALIVLFSAFVALTAQLKIPLQPIPFTLQTLGVLLTGALLGSRRGALALLAYLIEGGLGLPVFAGGAAGLPYMLGATGGYLIGFVPAAALVGRLAERGWDRRIWLAVLAMAAGNLVIYACGASWLAIYLGSVQKALLGGVLPFIPGDLIKIGVAALALPGGWALVRKRT